MPNGSCAGAYQRQVAAGETDLAGEATDCECMCGDAMGSTCPEAVVTRYFTAGCANPFDSVTVLAAGCTPINAFNAGSWTATAAPAGGSCTANDLEMTAPATFNDRVACAADVDPGCEGAGQCSPHPGNGFEPRICIMESGDVDCTSASFALKRLLFTGGHQDDRQCDAPCECGPPSAVCSGVVSGRQLTTCGSAQDGVTVGTCADTYVDSNQSLTFAATGITQGACADLPREAVGAITGLEPITLCCSGVL